MQASLKLVLALAVSALASTASAQNAAQVDSTPARIANNPSTQRQTPDTSFGTVLGSGAAAMDSVKGSESNPGAMAPNVAKTPTPGGPVPIPYPSTPLDTPAAIRTPLDRPLTRAEPSPVKIEPVKTPLPVVRPVQPPSPTPAWPSKIESIGIKQSR